MEDLEEFHLLESLGEIDQALGLNASEIRAAMIHETKLYGATKAIGFANWLHKNYVPSERFTGLWRKCYSIEESATEELYALYLETL